jgi:hypothetical protein
LWLSSKGRLTSSGTVGRPYKWLADTHPRLPVIEHDWLIKGSLPATIFRVGAISALSNEFDFKQIRPEGHFDGYARAVVTIGLPFRTAAETLGMRTLTTGIVGSLFAIATGYIVVTEFVKRDLSGAMRRCEASVNDCQSRANRKEDP